MGGNQGQALLLTRLARQWLYSWQHHISSNRTPGHLRLPRLGVGRLGVCIRPHPTVPTLNSSCFRGHRSFVNLSLPNSPLRHPFASPPDVSARRTPRPALYFLWRRLPFMSVCASPLESRMLIDICPGQTHSASVCRKLLKKWQTKPLAAGAYRTPTALDHVRGRRLPAMPQRALPTQLDLAAEVFGR